MGGMGEGGGVRGRGHVQRQTGMKAARRSQNIQIHGRFISEIG